MGKKKKPHHAEDGKSTTFLIHTREKKYMHKMGNFKNNLDKISLNLDFTNLSPYFLYFKINF